jgi:hypothetical protein
MFTRIAISSLLMLLLCASPALARRAETASEKRRVEYDRRLGSTYDDTFRVAARIRLGKPIGEFEAYALASAYFFAHINGCGGAELPKDKGDRWIAQSKEGYAGAPGPQVIVEKKTGITYSPGRPKVKDPKEYLKFIRNI